MHTELRLGPTVGKDWAGPEVGRGHDKAGDLHTPPVPRLRCGVRFNLRPN